MNKCEIQQTNYLRANSAKKNYALESHKNFDQTKTLKINADDDDDDDNISDMKISQSFDDLLDVDENENQNEEDTDETENDDDDDTSTQLSINDANATRQKKSNKKKGKLQQLIK